MLFEKLNFQMLIAALILIVLGLILMSGGGTENPDLYSEALFSFRRITLAPIIMLAGYGLAGMAIMRKSPTKKEAA